MLRAIFLLAMPTFLGAELLELRDGSRLEAQSVTMEGRSVFITTKNEVRIVELADLVNWPPKPKPATPAATPAGDNSVHRLLDEAADRHGLPPELLHAVAQSESGYQQSAKSGAGAVGVMQLMPATARAYGANPHDTAQNIDAGTRFLRELLVRYQNDLTLALAAYNAGPGAVDHFGGVPPYRETQQYVRKTIRAYQRGRR